MHNLLTVKETAKYLRIPLPTVYYLVQRGQLPAIQIGGRWRIKKTSLDKDVLKEDKSGQPTVLVVDDDESLQNLFKLFLKKIGFSRVVVGTVREALAALDKQKFDLLFLDLKLPDGPADDVLQLPDVTRPPVLLEQVQDRLRHTIHRPFGLGNITTDEVLRGMSSSLSRKGGNRIESMFKRSWRSSSIRQIRAWSMRDYGIRAARRGSPTHPRTDPAAGSTNRRTADRPGSS